MAAYRRVYDSRHLQADCQEPGSALEPCARQSSMATFTLTFYGYHVQSGCGIVHKTCYVSLVVHCGGWESLTPGPNEPLLLLHVSLRMIDHFYSRYLLSSSAHIARPSVTTSRYCIRMTGRIELVFSMEAFFHLSYTVL